MKKSLAQFQQMKKDFPEGLSWEMIISLMTLAYWEGRSDGSRETADTTMCIIHREFADVDVDDLGLRCRRDRR